MAKEKTNNSNSAGKRKRVSVPSENSLQLAKRIEQLLKRQKETESDLAKKTGLSKSAVSKAVSAGNISLATAITLSKHFNVSIDYLCGLSDAETLTVGAINMLESQIILSDEQTEKGAKFVSAKISNPICEYLNALKSAVPEDIKAFYIQNRKAKLVAAMNDRSEQKADTMKKYIVIEYNGLDDRTQLPPDFENTLDGYLRL